MKPASSALEETGRSPATGGLTPPLPAASAHAWYTLFVLTLVYTCQNMDRSVANLVLEPVKAEFHLTDAQMGFLSGLAFALPYSLVGLPVGYLVDRFNRVKIISAMLALWSTATAAAGFSSSYLHLLAARMAVGASETGAGPASMSIIADRFSQRQRSFAVSLYYTATSLGQGATFLLVGLVLAKYGWRAAFFAAGVPGLLLVLLLLTTVREPKRGAMEHGDKTAGGQGRAFTIKESVRFAMGQPALLHIMPAIILSATMNMGVTAWLMSFMIRVLGLPTAQAGLIMGLVIGICGGLGVPIFGFITDRLAAKRDVKWLALLPAFTTLATVACAIGAIQSPSVGVFLVMIIAYQIMSRGYFGSGYGLSVSLVKPGMRGVTESTVQIGSNLIGAALGPTTIGLLSDHFGGHDSLRWAMTLNVLLVGSWAALHFFGASRTVRRDLERVSA